MQKSGNNYAKQDGNLLFSAFLKQKDASKKIAFIAVFTALSAITNMLLEVKIFDVQFSITIVVSVISGIALGPLCGFAACMAGDFIGYVVNSWGYLYFVWVGIATGFTAFISGVVFTYIRGTSLKKLLLKIGLVCILHLIICTIGISSTGFYIYNKAMGFSKAVLDYASGILGSRVNYPVYLLYRLIFKGQIFNSIANYVLLFCSTVVLSKKEQVIKYL